MKRQLRRKESVLTKEKEGRMDGKKGRKKGRKK